MTARSLFTDEQHSAAAKLRELNQTDSPIFLIPHKYISQEAAQVGLLLSYLSRGGRGRGDWADYKSFFANSSLEAVQGAIKLCRHRAIRTFDTHRGRVLLICSSRELQDYFRPPAAPDCQLAPNLDFASSIPRANQRLQQRPHCAVFFRPTSIDELCGFRELRAPLGPVVAVDLSLLSLDESVHGLCEIGGNPGLVIWGESLTRSEIPFGAFTATNEVYRPWSDLTNCLIHSSTYSGNRLALSVAKDRLTLPVPREARAEIAQRTSSSQGIHRAFADSVNPQLPRLYRLMGYDALFVSASGTYLGSRSPPTRVFDAMSGGGLGIFGHSPPDLKDALGRQCDQDNSSWDRFAASITALTGFERVVPAVSGASAVEQAIMLALLAQPPSRRYIVTFSNNYSGKLLLPLCTTAKEERGPTEFFGPLYGRVITIDPSCPRAVETLERTLASNNVGLVWTEYVCGRTAKPLPTPLVQAIFRHREEHGYYVGFDEVLTGMYRTGALFSFSSARLEPDLVTLSKALSYLSFPFGVALARSHVYARARQTDPEYVERMEHRYRNELGARIAHHVVQRIETLGEDPQRSLLANVSNATKSIQPPLSVLARSSRVIRGVSAAGLIVVFDLHVPWWIKLFGQTGRILYRLMVARFWMKAAGVFVFYDTRLLPSLTISPTESEDLVRRAQRVFDSSPARIVASYLSDRWQAHLRKWRLRFRLNPTATQKANDQ